MIYEIITVSDSIDTIASQKLALTVNIWYASGWEPLGGVAIAVNNGEYTYSQAVVPKEKADA